MTRLEAQETVCALVQSFCADDVKDWLADACQQQARIRPEEEREWLGVASDLLRIANRGV